MKPIGAGAVSPASQPSFGGIKASAASAASAQAIILRPSEQDSKKSLQGVDPGWQSPHPLPAPSTSRPADAAGLGGGYHGPAGYRATDSEGVIPAAARFQTQALRSSHVGGAGALAIDVLGGVAARASAAVRPSSRLAPPAARAFGRELLGIAEAGAQISDPGLMAGQRPEGRDSCRRHRSPLSVRPRCSGRSSCARAPRRATDRSGRACRGAPARRAG